MSTNTNVFPRTETVGDVTTVYGEKFVDFSGLSYFWGKAKSYVDAADKLLSDRLDTLEGVVGDSESGLVKGLADLKATVDALGNIEGGQGIGGMIDAKIEALNLDTRFSEADTAAQGYATAAETSAKNYADAELGKLATALRSEMADDLAEAKKYTDDEIVEAVGAYAVEGDAPVAASGLRKEIAERDADVLAAAKTYADGLDSAMNTRVEALEAIDHDKLAADAAASAVATVVDGAPEAFDTLKEIADWIQKDAANENGFDAAARIVALEAADTEIRKEFKDADDVMLAAAKKYADDQDGVLAEQVANDLAAALGAYTAEGVTASGIRKEIEDSLAAAKTYTDGKDSAMNTRVEALETALANTYATKEYVDEKTGDALDAAKVYTDELFASIQIVTTGDIDTLFPTNA